MIVWGYLLSQNKYTLYLRSGLTEQVSAAEKINPLMEKSILTSYSKIS